MTGARANDGEFKGKLLLSPPADTLVILMGIKHLRSIARDLVASCRPREIVIGEVVKLSERLQWFESSGKKLNIFVASA